MTVFRVGNDAAPRTVVALARPASPSHPDNGKGSGAGLIARELERYDTQLHEYVQLAARLGGEPVRAALYFPLLGIFRERVAV